MREIRSELNRNEVWVDENANDVKNWDDSTSTTNIFCNRVEFHDRHEHGCCCSFILFNRNSMLDIISNELLCFHAKKGDLF